MTASQPRLATADTVRPALSVEAPWPLAGSAEFELVSPDWRAQTAERLRDGLQRHVIEPWFPRSIDRLGGGFLCDFDRRWRPSGKQDRMLEFQARQTRAAARLGLAFPADVRWPEIALHGFTYLREVMHDSSDGGFFGKVDSSGQPLDDGSKHAHGTAYAIAAGVELYRLTGSVDGLDMAREAFAWLERTCHDGIHGGYHGWTTRDGRLILSAADVREPAAKDPLGHGIGLKDANVNSDLMDAFALLVVEWPDPMLRTRLLELHEIVTGRFVTQGGSMHYLLYPDLSAVPGIERFGYPLQTAARLPLIAPVVGRSVAEGLASARRILDHVIEWGWDGNRGGFVEAGPSAEPTILSGVSLRLPGRPWWVQSEAVILLALLAVAEPGVVLYRDRLGSLLDVIENELTDARYGGWYAIARGDWSRWTRLSGRGIRKGDVWKDASHETDMYLTAIRILRGLHPRAPIET